jgi:co-chaperonin GroES (HSP10)
MTQIRLLGNRVHLALVAPKLQTESGLHLVDRYLDDRMQYRVLGIGPGKRLKGGTILPIEVAPGMNVLIPRLQDSTALPDGTFIVNADQIWAAWT